MSEKVEYYACIETTPDKAKKLVEAIRNAPDLTDWDGHKDRPIFRT